MFPWRVMIRGERNPARLSGRAWFDGRTPARGEIGD
jgi:hypothetical protein